jgi:hypothetical protein
MIRIIKIWLNWAQKKVEPELEREREGGDRGRDWLFLTKDRSIQLFVVVVVIVVVVDRDCCSD